MEKLIEVYNSIHGNKYNYSHSDFNLLKSNVLNTEFSNKINIHIKNMVVGNVLSNIDQNLKE